jgi:hypothetical protein
MKAGAVAKCLNGVVRDAKGLEEMGPRLRWLGNGYFLNMPLFSPPPLLLLFVVDGLPIVYRHQAHVQTLGDVKCRGSMLEIPEQANRRQRSGGVSVYIGT